MVPSRSARRWLGAVLVGLSVAAARAQSDASDPLPACPPTPNCVSTEADPGDGLHHLPPLPLPPGLDPVAALDAFEALLAAAPRTAVVAREPLRLRATDRTRLLRFVDDVEARVDVDARVLHVRSASRVGSGDMGTNRRRVTTWLTELAGLWAVDWPASR
jgi:uncharacterized protein (DUF1499 family)